MTAALLAARPGRNGRANQPVALLVEPSRPLAEELAEALRQRGWTVELVGYPLEVPGRAAATRRVHVLLLDPGPYCVPCLVRALRTVPALRRVPFVLLPRWHAEAGWVLRQASAALARGHVRAGRRPRRGLP